MNTNRKQGFTLIELMVTIAIIAIMSAIVIANVSQARAKARDSKRVSDISQIRLAATLFFERCNVYPAYPLNITDNGTISGTSYCPAGITLETYLAKVPVDPTNTGSYVYKYAVSPTQDDYHIGALLETNSSALQEKLNMDSTNKSPTWTNGFNGTGALFYDVGSR